MSDPAIKSILKLHAPLLTLVPSRNMHAQKIPQQVQGQVGAYPCLVFTRVGSSERETMCGTDGFVQGLWQIDTYDKDRDRAIAAAGAVRDGLVHYSGTLEGVYVNKIRRDTSFDIGPETEPGLYRRCQTFTIWYVEN